MKNSINSLYKERFTLKDIFFLLPLDKISIFYLLLMFPISLWLTLLEFNYKFDSFFFFINLFLIYSISISFLLFFSTKDSNINLQSKYDLIKYITIENKKERISLFDSPSNIHLNKSVDYNPDLVKELMSSTKPSIIKNDFFPNNIVTLLTNRTQIKSIKIDYFNKKYLLTLLSFSGFFSCYVNATINWNKKDNNMHFVVVNLISEPKNYFHFYSYLNGYYSNEEIKELLFSFIFYHEMNHSSLLQHRLNLIKDEFEAISDICSLIMLKKKYNMDKKQFSALIKAACKFRENNNLYPKINAHYFNIDCFIVLRQINNWNESFLEDLTKEEITDFALILKLYISQNIYNFEILNLISPFYSAKDVILFLNTYTKTEDRKKIIAWNNELSSKYNLFEHVSFMNIKKVNSKYKRIFNGHGYHFILDNYENINYIVEDTFQKLPKTISMKDIIQYSSVYNKEFYNSIVYDDIDFFNYESLNSFFSRYGYNVQK